MYHIFPFVVVKLKNSTILSTFLLNTKINLRNSALDFSNEVEATDKHQSLPSSATNSWPVLTLNLRCVMWLVCVY